MEKFPEIEICKLVKIIKENMSEMAIYHDPKYVQYYTAQMVKLSCQATLLCSNKKNARTHYWAGAVSSFGLSWLAFSKRTKFASRLAMSIGAAQLGGALINWKLVKPDLDWQSSIMKLDRAQDNVLSDVVIKEYHADPRTRPIISKYLYAERVLNDSSTDQAEMRWRCRYFSGDDSVYSVNFLGAGEQKCNKTEEIHRIRSLIEEAAPSDHDFGI